MPNRYNTGISFIVNTLSKFLMDLRHVQLVAEKNVLRYLKGTFEYGLQYDTNPNINMQIYVYSY